MTQPKAQAPRRKPSTVEDLLLGCTIQEVPKLVPGVVLSVALVALFVWLTDLLNTALGFKGLISYILTVIVAGILVRNLFTMPPLFLPGIGFCLKKILRLGIILMGIRLSIFDVLKIGAWGIPIVVVAVISGLVVTSYFGRLLKLPDRLATLIAVGTSICGVSAIVATAPGINAKDEEVTYAIANITVFGIIALVVYPFLSHLIFGGDQTLSGLFTGTAIHETAQVAASGMIHDQTFGTTANPTTADVAMVTKLVRNVLMALVIPIMTFVYARRTGTTKNPAEPGYKKALKLFPIFILGFLLLAVIRSIGDAGLQGTGMALGFWNKQEWADLTKAISQWSGYILATAMAGVGLGTSFRSMKGLGIKPFYVGFVSAAMVGVVAIVMVFLLGRFVNV
ncbi:MAG: putative sulfate exporter family transporter [Dehalococcoidia bacterium]|nr:putative sulfate exporter family transporter [Dehalococcoidia bacterium]